MYPVKIKSIQRVHSESCSETGVPQQQQHTHCSQVGLCATTTEGYKSAVYGTTCTVCLGK